MAKKFDLQKFKNNAALHNRYTKQLTRLRSQQIQTDCIEHAVKGATANLAKTKTASLVIYGEPQHRRRTGPLNDLRRERIRVD